MATNSIMVLRWLMFIAGVLAAMLAALTVIGYFVDSTEYRFGTEIASWRYGSATRYLGTALAELLLAAISIAGFLVAKTRPSWLVAQAVPLALFVIAATVL